ncbi:MAG: MFS transporter [Catenulispora sp.]|nr:MFS transporter [Catenulispora sp.]
MEIASTSTRRWWAVVAMSLALLAGGLDLTVLNLALPTLAESLHAKTSALQWIVASYSLVLSALLLPGGLFGDRWGRKKFLLLALVLFGGASLWCAYSTSPNELIAARAALGAGGALLVPLSLGVLPSLFSEAERPRAVSVLLGSTVVAYPLGPILGGWLLKNYWWGSVFLINLPVTLIALVAVAVLLPESRAENPPWLDVGGILLSSAGLTLLTFATIGAAWGSLKTWLEVAGGLLILVLLVFWERRVGRQEGRTPLIEIGLFRSASFSWGTILATMVSFAMFGILFTVPQYFQDVRGTDAMGSGLRLLPMILGLIIGAAAADRMVAAIGPLGPKTVVTVGFVVMAAGLFMGTAMSRTSSDTFMGVWIGLTGAGVGFSLPTSMDAALGKLSKDASGVGSGLIQAVRQTGATFGVAILGTVVANAYSSRLNLAGLPAAAADAAKKGVAGGVAVAHRTGSNKLLQNVLDAFSHGTTVMLLICGSLAVVGALMTLAFLPRQERSSGDEAKKGSAVASGASGASDRGAPGAVGI